MKWEIRSDIRIIIAIHITDIINFRTMGRVREKIAIALIIERKNTTGLIVLYPNISNNRI